MLLVIMITVSHVFAQQPSALRDYVGLISQSYHPDIVAYFEKMKADFAKKGETNTVRAIDIFLKGDAGSGFIITDARGNLYMITNNHVISQAFTISATFERQDGFKRRLEGLKIIALDEENDLALLAFATGDKPVDRGLSFLTRPANEGETVFSAGFPGLGSTPIWQFGQGIISNASARFPKSNLDDTLMGPFLQHTAQIDPGNSGGPLLVVQANVPTGYAVVGVNTYSGIRRQAANFSIPVNTTQTFINNSLNQKPENYRAELDTKLAKFVEGLGANRAVYPHIADFLSTLCIGENAEYAIDEMYDKGNASSRKAFVDKADESIIGAMGFAVAWTIENSIRAGGAIRAAIKEVTGAGEEYTVVFTINNKDVSSKWIREYGNWKIRTFSTVAAGDKSLLSQKKEKKEREAKLRSDSDLTHVEVGFAHLFTKAPAALYISADFLGYVGGKVYYAGPDFSAFGFFVGYRAGIPVGTIGLMPFIRFGFDYMNDQEFKDYKNSHFGGFPIAVMVQGGVKVTSTYVPGLFLGVSFQYNVFDMMDFGASSNDKYDYKMKMGLGFSVGYAF
jgi:serine protease Do